MEIRKNFPLMDVINSLNLQVQDSGYAVLDRQWNMEQTCSPYSKIYLVESGEALLYTDKQEIVIKPGQMYLIPTGCNHGRQCNGRLTKLFFHVELKINGDEDLLQSYGRILEMPMSKDIFGRLMQISSGVSFTDALLTRQYLYQLLNAFDARFHIAERRGVYRSELVMETIIYIQSNLSASLKVYDLAKRRFVSKTYLEKRFQEEVGISVGRYIDDQLMRMAQWWLTQTSHGIAEISRVLGYQDPCYFTRRFRQLNGVTPLEYRRTNHY